MKMNMWNAKRKWSAMAYGSSAERNISKNEQKSTIGRYDDDDDDHRSSAKYDIA